MRTNVPGFQSFYRFLHHVVLAKLLSSDIRVNDDTNLWWSFWFDCNDTDHVSNQAVPTTVCTPLISQTQRKDHKNVLFFLVVGVS